MTYDIIKSLHIIFVVSWFAGLFYIVRLFIYHIESTKFDAEKQKILQEQFCVMEKKCMVDYYYSCNDFDTFFWCLDAMA